MIRSSKVSIGFLNKEKRIQLHSLIGECERVLKQFVDIIWDMSDAPKYLPKEITSQVETWLSARMVQSIGTQASSIVRGTKKKQEKRLWMVHKLEKDGKMKRARKLYSIYQKNSLSKPQVTRNDLWLDSRFVKIDLENGTSFDGWVTLTSLGNKLKLPIPFNRHRQFNKWLSRGYIKCGVRLNRKSITFVFEIPEPKKSKGNIIGIDIGMTNAITASNGFSSSPDIHGHTLATITKKMLRKKRGSKGFEKVSKHRENHINWTINQLNLSNVTQVNIEGIKNLRKGKKSSRFLSHWVYRSIFDKLGKYCEEQGVLVQTKSPTYTSQRCSNCGWTRKGNRKGKQFECDQCGNTLDADLNASRNIALDLPAIKKGERLRQINRTGFYWLVKGREPIVPVVQKAN